MINNQNLAVLSEKVARLESAVSASTSASGISYNNTDSGLTADDVQAAIDELNILMGTQTSLMNNIAVTAGEWVTQTISSDINNFKYLGVSYTRADNTPDQAKNLIIIPVSAFKLSSKSSAVCVIDDYLTGADSKSLWVAYVSDTSIAIYRGSDLASRRISINGIM